MYACPLFPTAPRVHVTCWAMYADSQQRMLGRSQLAWNLAKCQGMTSQKNAPQLRDRGDFSSRWKHLETAWCFYTDDKLCASAWTVFVAFPQAEIDNFEVRTFAVVAFVPFGAMFGVFFLFFSSKSTKLSWTSSRERLNLSKEGSAGHGGDATQSSDSSKIRFLHAADTVQACTHHWWLNGDAHADMKLRFDQVTSRCLFITMPCSFVSSLSSAPLTQRVSSTPFHPLAHLSFPHPSSLAVPLNTIVHGHVRSQCPRKIIRPRSGCCMNARKEWPFLCFGCAGMTLQTTRSLFPTTSRLLSSNASLNDADRCCMLLHTTRYAEAMIRGPPSQSMGYAVRGPLTYIPCPNVATWQVRLLLTTNARERAWRLLKIDIGPN